MVNIGLDFDGVITDPINLKIKLARELLGLELTPENATKEKILGNGVDVDKYNQIFRGVISSNRRYELDLTPNAKDVIDRLYENHKIYIITSRHNDQIPYVKDWLEHKGIKYHLLINTSDQSKNQACIENKIKVYLDDDLHKLEQITNNHTLLFLLTRPYNKDNSNQELRKNNIQRVNDWKAFYNKIKHLL